MKTFLKITALAAITVALLGPARLFASQPAEPAQTYHGTITGGTFYCDGQSDFRPIVTGTWNVNIDPQRRLRSRSTSSMTVAMHLAGSGTTR